MKIHEYTQTYCVARWEYENIFNIMKCNMFVESSKLCSVFVPCELFPCCSVNWNWRIWSCHVHESVCAGLRATQHIIQALYGMKWQNSTVSNQKPDKQTKRLFDAGRRHCPGCWCPRTTKRLVRNSFLNLIWWLDFWIQLNWMHSKQPSYHFFFSLLLLFPTPREPQQQQRPDMNTLQCTSYTMQVRLLVPLLPPPSLPFQFINCYFLFRHCRMQLYSGEHCINLMKIVLSTIYNNFMRPDIWLYRDDRVHRRTSVALVNNDIFRLRYIYKFERMKFGCLSVIRV